MPGEDVEDKRCVVCGSGLVVTPWNGRLLYECTANEFHNEANNETEEKDADAK